MQRDYADKHTMFRNQKRLNWKTLFAADLCQARRILCAANFTRIFKSLCNKANMLLYFNYVATQNRINLQFEDESVANLEMSMGMIDLCIALTNYAWHLAQSSTVLR